MELLKRMKMYESVPKVQLMRKTPVIIRIDGKAFHTFTKGFQFPFDGVFRKSMADTMMYLCKNIQGCVMGYTQSDEITLLLQDWENLETDAWFDYEVQKICSVSASMATLEFNKRFYANCRNRLVNGDFASLETHKEKNAYIALTERYQNACRMGAMFDSRCFNVPFTEIENVFIWRQQDATRNSIQALAQSLYSYKEIEGIKNNELQNKMFTEKGVNWNDIETEYKRGCCCVKEDGTWIIDREIPIFTAGKGNYIAKRLPIIGG